VGHHQVETRISEKTHILQCGHQELGTRSRFTMFGEVRSYIYIYIIHLISTSIESHKGLMPPKTKGEINVQIHLFFNSTLDGNEW
jgi:hypothetical protein